MGEQGQGIAAPHTHTHAHTERELLTHLCKKVLHSKFLVCCAAAAAAFGLCSLSFRSIQVGNFNFKLE